MPNLDETPNLDLGGDLRAWWDHFEQKIVFYDFVNDEGFSLSPAEWWSVVEWARANVPVAPGG